MKCMDFDANNGNGKANRSETTDILTSIKENSMRIRLLENRFGNDIKTLYDGYMLIYEKLSEIQGKIDGD